MTDKIPIMGRPSTLRERRTSNREVFPKENKAIRIPIETYVPEVISIKDGFLIPETVPAINGSYFLPISKLREKEEKYLELKQHPWYKQGTKSEEGWYIPVSECIKYKGGSFIPEEKLYSTYKLESSFQQLFKGTDKICLALGCLLVLLGVTMFCLNNEPKSFEVNDYTRSSTEITLEDNIEELKQDFPSQDDNTWFTFLSGIKSVNRDDPNKPSVFLLLYTDSEKTANCLANKISLQGISFLTGNNYNRINPLTLFGPDLKNNAKFIEDPGNMIPMYRPEVTRLKAMVVTELHEVPGPIAQMFHYFCDRESPAVERAVYFFTLKNERPDMKSVQKAAELTLENLWKKSLTENLLAPLITRLTGNVVQIKPEYRTPSYC